MPQLLKRILTNELRDALRKIKVRNKFEQFEEYGHSDVYEEPSLLESCVADEAEEPENRLLENERFREVHAALHHLNENEQTVIRSYFFQRKNTVEIAREMNCTSQNVGYIKRTALLRLGRILERRAV